MLRGSLILALFLPGSRAALAATNENNLGMIDGGRQLAKTIYEPAPVETSGLKQVHDSVRRSTAESFLPWILGGLPLVTVAGIVYHMMPGLGGGSRTENFNYRIPPSWSPETDSSYSFRAYMTDISLWVMLTDLAPHQQLSLIHI